MAAARAGALPNPNVSRVPALVQAFMKTMDNAAASDRAFTNTSMINERAPELKERERRLTNQADIDVERDPASLARQKTSGIMERERLRQEGANERANIRRYGGAGTVPRLASEMFQYAVSQGFNPAQAAALTAHMQSESSFNMGAVGDKDKIRTEGQRGAARYGFGFRLDRQEGIERYAKETGKSLNDPRTSIDYLAREMKTSHAGKGGKEFFESSTPDAASAALSRVIGHSTKGPQAGETGARIALSRQYTHQFGGDAQYKPSTARSGAANNYAAVPSSDGKIRAYLPRFTAESLQRPNSGYTVRIDPTMPQNSKGEFPYIIETAAPDNYGLPTAKKETAPTPAPAPVAAPAPVDTAVAPVPDVTGSIKASPDDDEDEEDDDEITEHEDR